MRLMSREIVGGYREMTAEIQLIKAIEEVRVARRISEEALAKEMARKGEALSRFVAR